MYDNHVRHWCGRIYMKNLFYVSIFVGYFFGCSSDPTSSLPESPVTIGNLTGQWNWVQSVDGTNHVVEKPTSSNTRAITIALDSTIKEYRNDTLIFIDKFRLIKAMTNFSSDSLSVIDFATSKRFNYLIFSLTSETLIIGYGLQDSFKDQYSKIN